MLNPHEAHNDLNREPATRDVNGEVKARPLTDREVPLPGMEPSQDPAMLAIHQWLDGELPEADARRADAKQVALWSRVATETDQRRRMTTPAHVAANIMAALPAAPTVAATVTQVAAQTTTAAATNTATSAAGTSTTTLFLVAAAMLAMGVVIGRALV
ncbi:MAG: hypothetical protein IT353_22875 [Gemmatimonadaceae bacterium]|nr:hypothetical protein [Gemmatimonadaceae bacterium]